MEAVSYGECSLDMLKRLLRSSLLLEGLRPRVLIVVELREKLKGLPKLVVAP